ncbi:MAG TPA: fibrillarin-like rRNA/tRNA 2'-O-methyltransferase [Nitrosopumilaceae archaeon]|nr:fibrillarin-like rRNA/tRNA 2'-O-methyltransferase [Nitrosopumilaceae archaeon]
MEEDRNFYWVKVDGQQKLATENLVIGNQVYQEKLVIKKGIEYRLWDPFRSKLAAAIMNGLEFFPFENKSKVLYLGVSTGTTVSHISDIVGPKGIIFGVEHASRVARDFLDRVASHRKNIIPILQDARQPQQYFSVYSKVDIVYVDIAQPDQTEIAIKNCKMFLKDGGYIFLVIKTRSIDVTKLPRKIIDSEINKLRESFEIIQVIDLVPYDKDHAMVIAKYIEKK